MMMSIYLRLTRSSCAIRLYKHLKLVSVVLLHVLSISSTRLVVACSLLNEFFVVIIITATFWTPASIAYFYKMNIIVPVNKR